MLVWILKFRHSLKIKGLIFDGTCLGDHAMLGLLEFSRSKISFGLETRDKRLLGDRT